jgi:hypothetical protein
MISKKMKTPEFHKINCILLLNSTLTVGVAVPKHRENLQHIIPINKKRLNESSALKSGW